MQSFEQQEESWGRETIQQRRDVLDLIGRVYFEAHKLDDRYMSSDLRTLERMMHPIDEVTPDGPVPVPCERIIKDLPFHEALGMNDVARLIIYIPKEEFTDLSTVPRLQNAFIEMIYVDTPDEKTRYVLTESSSAPYATATDLQQYVDRSGQLVWGLKPEILAEQVSTHDSPEEIELYSQSIASAESTFLTQIAWMVEAYDQRSLPLDHDDPQAA